MMFYFISSQILLACNTDLFILILITSFSDIKFARCIYLYSYAGFSIPVNKIDITKPDHTSIITYPHCKSELY